MMVHRIAHVMSVMNACDVHRLLGRRLGRSGRRGHDHRRRRRRGGLLARGGRGDRGRGATRQHSRAREQYSADRQTVTRNSNGHCLVLESFRGGRAAGFGDTHRSSQMDPAKVLAPRHGNGAASVSPRDQFLVVVSVDLRVVVVSPNGETVVPLEVEPDVLVVTPLTVVVLWLLVSVETTGAGMTGFVVCVVVVLEEEDCAKAPPVISVTAIAAASKVLIISNSPGGSGENGDRSPWFRT
jgi:hypothetical protein